MAPLVIKCPQCTGELQLPPEMAGKLVKCPVCQATFTARMGAAGPIVEAPTPDLPLTPVGRSRDFPRRDVDRFDNPRYDDDGRRPGFRYDEDHDQRRRRREESAEDRYRRRQHDLRMARESVAPPAIALMILGGLTIAASLIFLALTVTEPPFPSDDRPARLAVSILGVCWGGFIIVGARMMKSFRYFGMAMAVSIMSMLSCGPFGIGFGIWAITVLNDLRVKDTFDWVARQEQESGMR